jgi:hypothetical protein
MLEVAEGIEVKTNKDCHDLSLAYSPFTPTV